MNNIKFINYINILLFILIVIVLINKINIIENYQENCGGLCYRDFECSDSKVCKNNKCCTI
jgi:hypothetical protein